MRPKRRLFPRTLEECVRPGTQPVLGKSGALQAKMIRDWARIVGKDIAALTHPEGLAFPKNSNADGALTLRVTGAHALAIQHSEPVILEKLAVYFGYRAVARIKIIHAPQPQPPIKKTPALAQETLPDIPVADTELRAALADLSKALQSHPA